MIERRAMIGGALAGAVLARAGAAKALAGSDPAALDALLDRLAKGGPAAERLAMLRAFDPSGLPPLARLDHDAVRLALETEAELQRRFPFGAGPGAPYVVTPRAGAWLRAEDPKADLTALVARITAETAQIHHDADLGVIPPVLLIDKTVAALLARAAKAPNELATALSRQAEALSALRPRASIHPGVSFKDRDAYVALVLRQQLGETLDPRAALRRSRAAGKVLTARADRLLRAQGFTQGGVGGRLRAIVRDSRWLYSDDAAGRDRAVADMNAWLDRARARLPESFATIPASAAGAVNRRMSPADEAAGRQGYRDVPADGRPGAYYPDLKAIRARPRWSLGSVAHHETLPGHLMQMPLEAASGAHSLRARLAAPALSEGWAIYAEQLADEVGAFAGDPLAELGYVQWMLFRVARLRLDLGLHLGGWSEKQGLAFLAEMQGDPVIFAPFAQEIERSAMAPGVASSQGLAWLELVRLRQVARRRGLDLKGFHSLVLDQGPLPFSLLEAKLARA